MVQTHTAYDALTKLYGQTADWRLDDKPENLFLKMRKDGSLSFEKRGLGFSVWFTRKVVPWFSTVIFRRPPATEYNFAENLDAFRKLILKAVSEVQEKQTGLDGVQTIGRMVKLYNGLIGSTTRGCLGTRLERFAHARQVNIEGCKPITAEQVLESAGNTVLMKTVRASFPLLFPGSLDQSGSKEESGLDPRLSLAIKLVVPGTSERGRISQAHQKLKERVQAIQDAHPSSKILGEKGFSEAQCLVSGETLSIPSSSGVSFDAMVSYLEGVDKTLKGIKGRVREQKKEELGRLRQTVEQLAQDLSEKNKEAEAIHFGKAIDPGPISRVDWETPSTIQLMDKKVRDITALKTQQEGIISEFGIELERFKKLQLDLEARIEKLETYMTRGCISEIVATQWIRELQEQKGLLTKEGHRAQQDVQGSLGQHTDDAFKQAVQSELERQQREVEEVVRPLVEQPKSIFDFIGGFLSGLVAKFWKGADKEKEINELSTQWYQQAKLYAYTERALARYKGLCALVENGQIADLPSDVMVGATSLVQKWHSKPTVQISKDDRERLFNSLYELERANTAMQTELEAIPDKNGSLLGSLKILRGIDQFAQVQERINTLAPIFGDDEIWGQCTPATVSTMRERFSDLSNSLGRSVRKMAEYKVPASVEEILKEIDSICRKEEEEVKNFLSTNMSGVWELWIKYRSETVKEKVHAEETLNDFLAKNAKERSVFIARSIVGG